jgi:DNA-binding SARP family transcriptional activator
MIDFRILGPIEVYEDGQALPLGGPRQLAMLAFLLLHAKNERVSPERLVEDLWRESEPSVAVRRLRVSIARLRAALGGHAERRLQTVSGGYALKVASGELDADRFKLAVDAARRALDDDRPDDGLALVGEALGCWRGPPLAEVAYEPFAQADIAILDERRLSAIELRVECELRLGRHTDVVPELEGLVGRHPTFEGFAAQLMLALYRCGRQAAALDVYQSTRRRLSDDFGLDPGPRLQALQAELLAQSPSLDWFGSGASADPSSSSAASERPAPARRDEPPDHDTAPSRRPFVGRARELARLDGHLTGALAGEARLVILSGDAGIGKTRLVSEFIHLARDRGARVLHGGGDEDGALSYQPVVEALTRYVPRASERLHAAGLGDVLAELALLIPELKPSQSPHHALADPGMQRFRLFQAVASVIEYASREQPLVLVLDDLQWTDRSTRQMLRYLVRGNSAGTQMIVAVHRSEGLAAFVSALAREGELDHIALQGLTSAETAQLVSTRMPDAPADLLRRLVEDTDGNPFFIGEVVTNLLDSGVPTEELASDDLSVPETVSEVIEQRLRRLSQPTGDALRAGAVAGREFSVGLLERVTAQPAEAVLDGLEEALAAGLIREDAQIPDRCYFAHAAVRNTLYRRQSVSRRIRLHLAVAGALEAIGDCHPAELANHFWQARHAGGAQGALRYLTAAGRRADAELAWEDAERHYERALEAHELTAGVDETGRGELLLAYGDAAEHSGHATAAKRAFASAAELARAGVDGDLLARAALGYGRAPGTAVGADATLISLLEEARAEARDDVLQARVLARLAVELSSVSDGQSQAEALSLEALQRAEASGDDLALAIVLASRHWTLSSPRALAERCAVAQRCLDLAIHAHDPERELAARTWWLYDLLELGRISEVQAQLEVFDQLARMLRHPSYDGYSSAMHATLSLMRGEFDAAAEQIEHAHDRLRRAEDPDAARVHLLQRFALHANRGEWKDAAEAVAQPPSARPIWGSLAAWAFAARGEFTRARACLVPIEDVPEDGEWLATMAALAYAQVALDDQENARLLFSRLRPFEGRAVAIEGLTCFGAVAHPLGLLAAVLGEPAEAARLLGIAVEFERRMGAMHWAHATQQDLAHLTAAAPPESWTMDERATTGLEGRTNPGEACDQHHGRYIGGRSE